MALVHHLPRVRHQLGQKLHLGGRAYRIRGYLGNRQSVSLAHEPHLMPVLRRALQGRPGAFVDVGVNTGQTLLKVLTIDPDRPYLGFEPQIGCCACIAQFIEDNALYEARILPMALSDCDGILHLHARNGFDEMASTVPQKGLRATPVVARLGDDVLAELGCDPAVIKIDVEGAELEVLRGLGATIGTSRPVLLFEVLPNFSGEDRVRLESGCAARNSARARQIEALLTRHGYHLTQIDQAGACHRISAFELDDPQRFIGRDYVAWPDATGIT